MADNNKAPMSALFSSALAMQQQQKEALSAGAKPLPGKEPPKKEEPKPEPVKKAVKKEQEKEIKPEEQRRRGRPKGINAKGGGGSETGKEKLTLSVERGIKKTIGIYARQEDEYLSDMMVRLIREEMDIPENIRRKIKDSGISYAEIVKQWAKEHKDELSASRDDEEE